MNENALNTFYNNIVKSDTTFSADYDTFKNGMQDANVRKELYKRLRESNSNFPSNDYDVDAVLGFQTTFDNAASKATNKAVSELRNDKYASLTDDELDNQWNNMLLKGEQKKSERIASAKNEMERFGREHPFLNAIGKIQGQGVSKLPSQSITPIEAIESKHASQFLDESDLEEFKALDKERGVRGHESGHAGIRETTMNAQNIVKDIRDKASRDDKPLSGWDKIDLNMAERINTKAQELVDAPSKYGEETGVSNWWQGLSDTLFDRDIISVVGMVRDMNVSHVVQKLNDGKELSDSENALIIAVANFDEVQERRSSDLSVGYQIGQGTAQCVPLIIDMMVTKGLGAAGKSALIKNLDKLVKAGKMSPKSLDRFARVLNGAKGVSYTSGKKDNAVRVTVGALEDGAKETFGQYAGDVARELIETGIQTYAMPSSQRQMIQEKTDLRRKTGENDIAFKDRARIFGNAYTQTFTERAGGKAIDWTLGKVFGMTNVLQKFGFDRGILKLLNDAVQNPISEIGEEYLGAIINLVRSTDLFDLYSEQSNEELRDEAMSMFTSEGFWQTVGTTLPMSLFGGAANYSAIKAETRKYNKSNLELSQYLQNTGMTKSQAENILRQIEGAKDSNEFKERMSILKTYLTNYIMENNTDTGIVKGKLEGMNTLLDTYSQNIDSYEEAIGGLKYALSSMSKEDKEKVATDFKTLVDKANKSITATPQTDGKDITPANKQSAGWTKRKYTVTIDGKKENITVQGELFFNEDGSINSTQTEMGKVHIQNEQGKNIRTTVKADKKKEIFDKYLDAINDELRKQKAQKDAEALAAQKAEEARKAELARIKAEEKAKLENENAKLEAEKGAIAQLEAEKQTILGSLPKDKQGELSEKDMKPEQKVLYWQQEDAPEAVVKNLTDQLVWEEQQISSIQEKDMSPADKVSAIRKHKNSIKAYEQAITKWLGQETLDAINAARAQALQNTPPVQGEAPAVPVQAPVVEQAQDDTPADAPAGPDTTPLPLPVATVNEEGTEGKQEGDGETPAPDTLGEGPAPAADKPTANLDEVTVWVAKNYDYIVTDKEGNTIFSSKPTRKKVTDAFEELHQVEGKVDGKRGTYNGEDCIIVRDNPAKGYVNIVTPHGIERVGREEVMIDGKPLKGKASVVEWRENNEKKYDTFESIMNFPVFDIRGEMNITFLDFLNTQQGSPYVAFYEMLRKHYREKYNDDVAQQYLDASVARLIENLKEVARLWNIVRTKRLISSGQMPTTLERRKMDSQSKRMKEAVAAVHNAVGLDNSIDFSGLAELSEKAAKKAEKKGEGEGYFAETDEEKAESYVDGLVSNILWVGFESENKHEHEDAVEGIVEALNKESKKASKQRELVVNILNDRLEEAKRLNRLNDIQAIERVIDRLSKLKKMKPILTEAGLIEEKGKNNAPAKPAPKKDTSALKKQLSIEENSLRDLEEDYKRETDEAEKSELEGYIAQAKEKIAKLKAEIDGAEFMVGQENSQPLTEAEDLSLAAALQSTNGMVQTVSYQEAEEERQRNEGAELMGSRVNRRMAEIAKHFNGKEVTNEQQVVVDVFSGKSDKQVISIPDANGNIHNVEMQQGNENRAGTKHAVFRHYNTKNSPINADDILLIPEIIREGAVNVIEDNGKTSYEYKMNINNSEYTLITEKRKGDELFVTFYKNGKAETSVASDTQQGARNNNESAFGDKGTTNFSNDQINSQNNSKTSFFIEQDGKFDVVPVDMIGDNSVILGYAKNGKIYLTPAGMNANTIIHEYTHIWAKALQQNNPKAWKSIVDTLKESKELWNDVLNDPNYESIKNDEDAVASEVLSRYSGERGAERLNTDAKRVITEKKGMEKDIKVKALIARVRKALTEFWSWVGKNLFDIESFSNINEIADRALYDMLNNTKLNLDNSKKSSTFAENNENYERTDEFRELQERSLGLSQSDIARYQSEQIVLSDEDKRGIGGVFQRLMESERNGGRNGQWINLTGKGNQFKIAQVNPAIFHDIFQICRNYLPNGELVDLHDNYADCKCFISEDGLCGFAIEPDGNLISVFSLNPRDKKGFLYAIKDLIRQEGATHLDCFVSNKQPLSEIYQKVLGFHVASEMDYNMEFDHDNIAENHGMPKVAFMVDKPTEKREFDKDSYDAAAEYQLSQTSTAEREQIIAEAKANGTFMMHNGQPTNLTEDQWVTVRTQAFKDYFGDWINDKDNASVVLDENGEPLVVHHGSRMAGFDKFGRGEARDSQGIYTTPNRRAAESYATSAEEWRSGQTMPEAELGVPDHHGVYSLFVNMRNPKVIDFEGKEFDRFGTPKYEVATNEALDNGERGILFDTLEEAEAYIAEHPEEDLDYVEKYTTSDDMLLQAKEEGYDGVIFTNIIDSRYPDPITNYVPFEPNQVKSATQNVGTFNPEDDRIEFMIGPAAVNETEEKIKKASEDVESAFVTADVPLPDKTNALEKLATAVCDSGEAFRQFMKALRKYRKKNHLGKLPEGRDIRQIYDNQRVVLKNKVTELLNLYETPLVETLDKLIKVVENSSMYQKYQEDKVVYTIEEEDADGKITTKTWTDYVEITPREFIERYLIACDSVERLNNGIPPRGLREFYSRMGVNVYDFQMEFEAAFASDGEGEALVKELWKRINAYTNYTLEDSYECGMLTDEEYNKRKARKFYVPERDFQAEKELEQTEIKPQKHYRSNKLASSKQAKGGNSLAANIIENMIHIGNIDLSKNNKNRVKLAMFNLLKENEDFRRSIGLPKPEEVWYDSDGKRVSNKPSKTLIERIKWLESQIAEYDSLIAIEESQAVPDTVEIAQLEKEMQDLIDERNGIPYMLEYDARDKFFGENNPHMVGVYVDGVLCSMQFPNMSLIATALNDTWADSLAVRDVLKRISGYMGSIITSYEPSFFAVNTVTDSIAILTKGYVELGTEYAARFIATTKDLGKHMSLITAYMTGKDYRSMESGDLFRDFLMNGGNTGYATIRNMEEILRELQVLDNNSNHIKDGVKWTKKALSFTNESAELLLRFAAYKAAIDCGYGIEKATWAANNLSANFNRTGKKFNDTKFGWRALGEAMEWFRSLSMFTNPSIQGAMSYLRMFGDSGELNTKERVAKYFRLFNAAMFMPALCGFLNAMMFDDDEKEEWAASEYDRANYLVLGKRGKWAVPHMLRPFYNIGVNIAMGMQGRRTGGDIADSIITSFLTHLTPLPPVLTETASKGIHSAFGNADFTFFDSIESLVSPQGINALKELADGENFLGYKVRYEGSTAQYTKNPNAGAFEKIIAEQFYIWGGGIKGSDSKITDDKDTIGRFWDVSPNEVKSVMQLFLPKLVIDVANITAGAVSEEHDVRLKDIPIVNRFTSDRTKEAYRAGIYSEANKIIKANDQIATSANGDIERLKIDLGKASSEEERVRIQREIDFYEGIYKQAKGDVFAVTIDKNLEKYKRIRMASLHKKYHHDEKSFKELYPDLRYDVIEDAERMFTFNMFQLICMYNGTGKVNDNLPNWMKDVFRMKPSTQEVNEMWEHYQKLQEETNERLGISEQ